MCVLLNTLDIDTLERDRFIILASYNIRWYIYKTNIQ